MSRTRVGYIDIAKAIGIVLVIIGHTVSSDTECKRILYAFHMPLFFILSGMVAKPSAQQKRYVQKCKSLMIPYVIWGLVYSPFSFKHLAWIAYGTRETLILAESLSSLWFLPVMLLAVMIAEGLLSLACGHSAENWIISGMVVVMFAIGFFIPHYEQYGDPFGVMLQ